MTSGPIRPVPSGSDDTTSVTAARVASETGGRLVGDEGQLVVGVAPLDRAGPDELSFLSHRRYAAWYATTRAGVVVVDASLEALPTTAAARIIVPKAADAMLRVLSLFTRDDSREPGVHPSARIADTAVVSHTARVDAGAVVASGSTVGARSWIGANAVVRENSRIGEDVSVHPGTTIYPDVDIGDRTVIHAGARIGREGFGFVPGPAGIVRIPHIGRCVIEHDVEIGANSCIDRGSVDDTVIGAHTKIDNLVHVAHNSRIGRRCFIAAQAGMAGSTRVEDGVQIGGQAGFAGHLTVGARATIAAQAGVFGDVPAGETWSGYPARPHKEQLRASAALVRLAKLARALERLAKPDAGQSSRDAEPGGDTSAAAARGPRRAREPSSENGAGTR